MRIEKIFWGSMLILASIGLVLSNLGYLPEINVFSLIVTVFLLSLIFKSIFKRRFEEILFPIAFLCILYDEQLGITEITPWTVLIAAALGTAGLHMIFGKNNVSVNSKSEKWESVSSDMNFDNDSNIKAKASFGEVIKYIKSDNFESADLKCSFGSMQIYFDNVKLQNGRGRIKLDATSCGVELYIPSDWIVKNELEISFGGVQEKNIKDVKSDNILTIVGSVSFASVDIIYV